MKVVILAGGLGTRLGEYTHAIPKPMVKIGPYPIIIHIMRHYIRYGFKDFIRAIFLKIILIILKNLELALVQEFLIKNVK